ncbi:MAG: hypothetical protein WDO74_02890 [Pseudomonadota bacterium]
MCWWCGACSSSSAWGIDDPVGAISVHGANGVWGFDCGGLVLRRQLRRGLERRRRKPILGANWPRCDRPILR